ncbi:MAG: hypothetical protein J2P26_09940, partial [Nocardiopsaceae bacterium]|nr:hypothetical protein [Nocardiopsaceae bacterium]
SGDDLLGIGDDVETLAELIAATETSPPLAIALIGDWGTGKSSAMLQVERHVGELAQRSRNNPGRSAFAANVRQVRFNAWHYSDDHLWTGIVSHLFTALAGSPDAPDSDSPDPGAAAGDAGSADDQRKIAAQRDRLRARLGEKRTARDRLARDLAAADDVPRPQGPLGWLGSPVQAGQVLITAVRQAFRDTRAALPALAAWIVLGVGAYLAWRFLGQPAAGAVTAIAALAPPAVTVARNLRSGHDAILRWAERERSRLAARQRGYDQEIKDLRDRLVLIDAAARLDRFLDDRGQAGSYRGYQGLLGQVHADLRELSADLAQARAQWAAEGGIGPPPLERIVLYIDDLDRCPPSRVVKVLDAVHLMLALDLFVVVVAVDARWLIRSLECHHQELFAEGDAGGEAVATPVDYLDKIFQIPFALRPPGPDATARYLRSLLPDPAPPADDTPSSGTLPGHALPGHALPGDALAGDALADGTLPDGTPAALASGTPAADPPAADSPDAQAPRGAPGPPTPEAIGAPARSGPPNGPGEPDPSRRPEASRVPVPPPATGDDEPKPPVVELRPKSLQLSRPEIEFMTRLGGLLPTPRAAKRLVNIYRLVRIGIPEAELSAFTGDGAPYRAVQVLLAILVGHPKAARTIFTDLLAPDTDDLATVAGKWDETDASFLVIKTELSRLRAERSLTVTAADCQRWCPLLARFSFYTRDLATA